jgi:lysosomal alpha-mannosidase
VVQSLLKNPERKFIYVEMAFFTRWWDQQTEQRKDEVRTLVKNGQLAFINAGWSMNDEAATYYQAIIDQMTLGHTFLKKEFNYVPRVGWHIDPFGHSATQASLFASMGFDSFIFGRIDHQDKDLRLKTKRMEMIWRGSSSLASPNDIFSGVTFNGYGPPGDFCFDAIHCGDPALQHRKDIFDYDMDTRADSFSAWARRQAESYQGDILLTFGEDFNYEGAESWFDNLDVLIKYFNEPENYAKYKLKLKYSNPEIYTDAKFASNFTWEVKTDDFFPYADGDNAYWTGYFTSRAAFKGYERYSNAYLQVCKHFESALHQFAPVSTSASSKTLSVSMGIAQHHDAVSGTAKQHVNDDYTKRLAMGCAECDQVAERFLKFVTGSDSSFVRCEYLNISLCDATENLTDSVTVVVYNSMAQTRSEIIRLPVSSSAFEVFDSENARVPSQVQPLSSDTTRARHNVDTPSAATHEIVFEAKVAGNSLVSYKIARSKIDEPLEEAAPEDDTILENDYLKVVFNYSTGLMTSIANKVSNLETKVSQTWEWYTSSPGDQQDGQASGAYIFRPVDGNTTAFSSGATISVIRGDVMDEVRQVFVENNLTQTVRLHHSKPFLEIEYTLGTIDVGDGIGKEVIVKIVSDLDSKTDFFTDANGREVEHRTLNFRPDWPLQVTQAVSGNYYPVNTRIFIQDQNQDEQLTIITDRSQGGSSLKPGELEVMVNRRTTHDDGRGVNEALDEDIVVRGKFWIFFDTIANSAESHRLYAERLQNPLAPFFTSGDVKLVGPSSSGDELPENLHLITYETREKGHILLRIGHLFAEGESEQYSATVKIDLEKIFGVEIVEELSLSANQELCKMKRLSWNGENKNPQSSIVSGSVVQIAPMEIRTYLVKPKRTTRTASKVSNTC